MKKHLVLIGGGHAHMVTLANLETFIDKGFGVTVIQPSEYHYYSGMGPGMLGGTYRPDDIRFATRRLVEAKGGRFVLGKASGIDPDKTACLSGGHGRDNPLRCPLLQCRIVCSPGDGTGRKPERLYRQTH